MYITYKIPSYGLKWESQFPINKEIVPADRYETDVFATKDCGEICRLVSEEDVAIRDFVAHGKYFSAVMLFLQLTKSFCIHYVADKYYEFSDEKCRPEDALEKMFDYFDNLVRSGIIPNNAHSILYFRMLPEVRNSFGWPWFAMKGQG